MFSRLNSLLAKKACTESIVIFFAILFSYISETFVIKKLSDTVLLFVSVKDEAKRGW
jgi:hypothetical protein